jgi:Caspase domain
VTTRIVRGVVLVVAAFGAAMPAAAQGVATLQRYSLVIGANNGGTGRPALQYALTDAESFARVMTELGGVLPANQVVLKQPRVRDLMAALDALNKRVADARRVNATRGGRIEIVLYYSGHADELGLLLGDDRYSYQTLRDRLDEIPADVRIAVLDACASGAFTRLKGGRARPPFLVDDSSNMRGHAFLTSSSDTEAAQESDRIRGSYFTHFLVSGFRGAADHSGDGKVTLNEAYKFAFDETLGRTVDTRGGAQHPSYDIKLSGSGDIVMTDMRQTSATLVLAEELDGRFFVRNASSQELVVELYKSRGRLVTLGLEPGTYDVRLERERQSLVTRTRVADGERVTLDSRQFGVAAVEPTQVRGTPAVQPTVPPPPFAVAGRNRLDLVIGAWWHGDSTLITSGTALGNFLGGGQFTHYFSERVAMTFGIESIGNEVGNSISTMGVFSGTASVVAAPIGIRWDPLREKHPPRGVKPYLMVTAVPAFGSSTGSFVGSNQVLSGVRWEATFGGGAGGGVDFHISRGFSIGVTSGYTWLPPFAHPIGDRDAYGGAHMAFTLGWLFGKGSTQ